MIVCIVLMMSVSRGSSDPFEADGGSEYVDGRPSVVPQPQLRHVEVWAPNWLCCRCFQIIGEAISHPPGQFDVVRARYNHHGYRCW